RVDARMRIEQKEIDAFEPYAVDVGLGCQIEHRVQIDRRLGARPFSDEPRPHRVMQSRVFMRHFLRSASASGLPGPKCLRMTSGSVSLRFSIRTPASAAVAVTNSSSSVICPKRIIDGVETDSLPNVPWPCVRMTP